MVRFVRFVLLYSLLLGCIEPFEFVVEDKEPRLVIEGYISDKSYNETLLYPSDGRYFTIKLSYTSDVINTLGQTVNGASVQLLDNLGTQIDYIDMGDGLYSILDPDFKAESGREYKLRVTLSGDDIYESSWESTPVETDPMGEIGFDEIEKQAYKRVAREKVVRTIKGINAVIQLPPNNSENKTTFYQWEFTTHWIFIAPLPPPFAWDKKCWVVGPYYLTDYMLQEDHKGGYKKNLFFIETEQNERIFEDFSVLINQKILPEEYYFFLKELQEQNQGALLSDKPPYNLQTNLKALNDQKSVIGYFGVVSEQAKRWYFNRNDLSYPVENKLKESCLGTPPFVPPPGCHSCLDYPNGEPSVERPMWWRD